MIGRMNRIIPQEAKDFAEAHKEESYLIYALHAKLTSWKYMPTKEEISQYNSIVNSYNDKAKEVLGDKIGNWATKVTL